MHYANRIFLVIAMLSRHVLIIDFWHPELTEAERAGLEFIYDLR
jgi:hypothetical protein